MLGLCDPVAEPAQSRPAAPPVAPEPAPDLLVWCEALASGRPVAASQYPVLRPLLSRQLPPATVQAIDRFVASGDWPNALWLVERSGLADVSI